MADYSGDYEPLTFTRPTARKKHKCGECGRDILAGETYRKHVFLFEGERDWWECCLHCETPHDWLSKQCHGYLVGICEEDIQEHVSLAKLPGQKLALLKLVYGIRKQWRRPNGHMMPIMPVPAFIQETAA